MVSFLRDSDHHVGSSLGNNVPSMVLAIAMAIYTVAVQTINYAYSLARFLKTDESYAQGLLILEQCESNQSDDSSKGLVLLAISKLLSERGNVDDAMEKLDKFLELNIQSMHEGVRIAASEALTGLHLEMGEDDTTSGALDDSLLLNGLTEDLDAHLRALKGLIELDRSNPESCNAALSYAEFLHTMRSFSLAKELYQKVIQGVPENKEFCDSHRHVGSSLGNNVPSVVLAIATAILHGADHLSLIRRSSSLTHFR